MMMRLRTLRIFLIAMLLSFSIALAAGEYIPWQVISSGGSTGSTGGGFTLSGTIGQTAVGQATSGLNSVHQGFWQSFATGGANCCVAWGVPGDANSDLAVNLLDILYTIGHLYNNPPGPGNPNGCSELLDANGDTNVNLIDILYLIGFLYNQPAGPGPVCPS